MQKNTKHKGQAKRQKQRRNHRAKVKAKNKNKGKNFSKSTNPETRTQTQSKGHRRGHRAKSTKQKARTKTTKAQKRQRYRGPRQKAQNTKQKALRTEHHKQKKKKHKQHHKAQSKDKVNTCIHHPVSALSATSGIPNVTRAISTWLPVQERPEITACTWSNTPRTKRVQGINDLSTSDISSMTGRADSSTTTICSWICGTHTFSFSGEHKQRRRSPWTSAPVPVKPKRPPSLQHVAAHNAHSWNWQDNFKNLFTNWMNEWWRIMWCHALSCHVIVLSCHLISYHIISCQLVSRSACSARDDKQKTSIDMSAVSFPHTWVSLVRVATRIFRLTRWIAVMERTCAINVLRLQCR